MTYRKRTLSRRYGKVASSSHSRKYFHTTLMSIIQIASGSTTRRRRLLLVYTLHISICSTLSFSQIKNIEWTYKKKNNDKKIYFCIMTFILCVWVIYWYEERKRWDIFFCWVYMQYAPYNIRRLDGNERLRDEPANLFGGFFGFFIARLSHTQRKK